MYILFFFFLNKILTTAVVVYQPDQKPKPELNPKIVGGGIRVCTYKMQYFG